MTHYYRKESSIISPCKVHRVSTAFAIIYPSGWTKTIRIDRKDLFTADQVKNIGGTKKK